MADVFISYKSNERHHAFALADILVEAGFTVWWDTSIVPGQHFNDAIQKELEIAKCIVVLWSHASHASEFVQAEALEGFNRKILVAARLDDVSLKYPFGIIQTVDLRPWKQRDDKASLASLLEGVGQKVGRAPKNTSTITIPDRGIAVASAGRSWTLLKTLAGHGDWSVFRVRLSADASKLLSADARGNVKVWDLSTDLPIFAEFVCGNEDEFYNHPRHDGCFFDGVSIVTAGNGPPVWHPLGKRGAAIKLNRTGNSKVVYARFCAVSAAAGMCAAIGHSTLYLFSTKSTQHLASHSGEYSCVAISPSGKVIACGTKHGSVETFVVKEGVFKTALKPSANWIVHGGEITTLCFIDEQRILTSSLDRTASVSSIDGKGVQRLASHEDAVLSAAYSEQARLIATASRDRTVKVWTIDGDLLSKNVGGEESRQRSSVDISKTGKLLVCGGDRGTIEVWGSD